MTTGDETKEEEDVNIEIEVVVEPDVDVTDESPFTDFHVVSF